MTDHALIKLLKTFSKDEAREFGDFVNSPFYNKRNAVSELYKIICDCYQDFNSKVLIKTDIFKKLFPGKKYNDSTFRVLISTLNELAVKYITLKYSSNDLPAYNLQKIRALLERNIFTGIDKIFSESHSYITGKDMSSIESYFHLHLYNITKMHYLTLKHSGVFDKFLKESELESGIENLTNYFYLKFLSGYINILNIEKLYNKKFDKIFMERIFSSIDKDRSGKNFIISIYYFLVLLLKDSDNENNYYTVKKIFYGNSDRIFKVDAEEIIVNLQNFCSRKISNGVDKFYEEKFDLYRTELKLKTYTVTGKMPPVFFTSLVSIALKMNELNWTKKFINLYSAELNEDERTDVVNYSLALCEFANGNFEKALELNSKIKFTNLYQKLNSKVLIIMIYFELDQFESLNSALEAFRHFLSNSKLIPKQKISQYDVFLKSLKKLAGLKQKEDEFGIKKFIPELISKNNFHNKSWIIEKAEELVKIYNSGKRN